MKTTTAVPLVAMLAAGVWIAGQFRSIAELKDRNARLHKVLAAAESSATATNRPVSSKTALDRKDGDWAEVARLFKQGQSAWNAPFQPTARLEAQFAAMNQDEQLAAVDEIAATAMPNGDRSALEFQLCIGVGLKADPKRVVDHFAHRYGEVTWERILADYFKRWIDKDPDQAITWLQQRAPEMGDVHELVRQSVNPLLKSNPDAANRILAALSESQRYESFCWLAFGGDDAALVARAETMRTFLSEKDRLAAVFSPTQNHSDGDGARMSMAQVDAYLDLIQATPNEREACILNAAEELGQGGTFGDDDPRSAAEKIEALRAWVADRAPGLVARATGEGLLSVVGAEGFSYADAADLALRFHDTSASDELLIPLLEHDLEHGVSDRDQNVKDRAAARAMAGRLRDESLRRKYLEKLNKPPAES